MATFNIANSRFEESFTLTKQTGSTLDIPLSGKYVDKDIRVTLNVRSATVAAHTASADVNIYTIDGSNSGINISSAIGTKATSEPTTGYYVALTASAIGNSQITQSGWVNEGALPAASTSTTKYFPIRAAEVTVTATGSLAIPTMTASTATVNGKEKLTFTPQTSNSINTEYYAAFTIQEASRTITLQTSTTAGYLGNNNQITANNLELSSQSATYYLQIPAADGAITMSAGSGSCIYDSGTNVTVSDSNTSGVSMTFKGKGSVSAIAAITTSGYAPITDSFASASATNSNEATLTKYITGVTLTTGKTFSITVPNGSAQDTITFVFTVDANNNVTVAGPD